MNHQMKAFQLQQRIKELEAKIEWQEGTINALSGRDTPLIKYSDQYIVMTMKDGEYSNPVIVTADCHEEALMPESEECLGNVSMAIPEQEHFREVG